MAMHSQAAMARRNPGDGHLWMTALGLSLLFNLGLLVVIGLCVLHLDLRVESETPPRSAAEAVATIYLEPTLQESDLVEASPSKRPYSRTSEDQPLSEEKTNERIGERSTRATSDRPPDVNAPALPSQRGVEPRENEIETTESRYQDGVLNPAPSHPATAPAPIAPPLNPSPAPLAEPPTQASDAQPQADPTRVTESVAELADPTPSQDPIEEPTPPPARDTLLDGPNPVEVAVPREEGEGERPRETPQRADVLPGPTPPAAVVSPRPPETVDRPDNTTAFQGNQRKTAMIGSISRTGRSALNVDETVEGRYQATIGKAVELEWQRNCMRHRDFITPGFLTVRFFIEPSGRVRTVQFVGEMETGEVQKGFTLSSIREADIPPMPKELAESYEGDAMELIFRFFF